MAMGDPSLYSLLNVLDTATSEEIDAAFEKIPKPDSIPDNVHDKAAWKAYERKWEEYGKKQIAYIILSDPEKKAAYDRNPNSLPPMNMMIAALPDFPQINLAIHISATVYNQVKKQIPDVDTIFDYIKSRAPDLRTSYHQAKEQPPASSSANLKRSFTQVNKFWQKIRDSFSFPDRDI
jgi:DnaJ-class molecular chaperone